LSKPSNPNDRRNFLKTLSGSAVPFIFPFVPPKAWSQVYNHAFWKKKASFPPTVAHLSIGSTATPFIHNYLASDFTKLSNPATLPTGTVYGAAYNMTGSLLALAHAASPYLTIYRTSNWAKLTNPTTLPTSTGYGVAISPNNSLVALASMSTPFIHLYSNQNGTLTKLSNPSALPANTAYNCVFNPSGTLLVVFHSTTPFITIYNTSDWSKLANPSSLPTGSAYGGTFSPDGSILAVGHINSPYLTLYNTSTWTKLTGPSSLPTGGVNNAVFSPNGSLLAVVHDTTPYISIYRTSDWSKLPNPSVLPSSSAVNAAFSYDNQLLAVTHYSIPYMTVYETKSWTKRTDPASLPTVINSDKAASGCAFSPNLTEPNLSLDLKSSISNTGNGSFTTASNALTFLSIGGRPSALFSGATGAASGNRVNVTNFEPALAWDADDFTFECWVYPKTLTSNPYLFDYRPLNDQTANFPALRVGTDGKLSLQIVSGGAASIAYTTTAALTLNSWSHVALVRKAGVFTYFINGTSVGTHTPATYTFSAKSGSQRPLFGSSAWSYNNTLDGHMYGIKIYVGKAIYTSNFTPTA
jgi:hypothetical protein